MARTWRKGSEFGEGLRVALNGERRNLWIKRIQICRQIGALNANYVDVGIALFKILGRDGKLIPSYETIADKARVSMRTVGRALRALKACGLVTWVNRITREGWQVQQTTNSYALTLDEAPKITQIPRVSLVSQRGRQKSINKLSTVQIQAQAGVFEISAEDKARIAQIQKDREARFRANYAAGKRGEAAWA
jgi:hypothetical protein